MATALVLRSNLEPTGGQRVLRQWFDHIAAHPSWHCQLFVTPEADWVPHTPWADIEPRVSIPPSALDLLLLEGITDWPLLTPAQRWATAPPRLHLIQHLRHADPHDDRFVFLGLPAIRVAVSEPVAEALASSGRCRGPVLTIPAGLPLPTAATSWDPQAPVLVLGLKAPQLAQALGALLQAAAIPHRLLLGPLPQPDFFAAITAAGLVVALPMASGEGFFLPALETLALGRPLIVPDAGGNRAFCRAGLNCLQPPADAAALAAAVQCLRADRPQAAALGSAGPAAAAPFSLLAERQAVHRLLDQLPQLWADVLATGSASSSRNRT
jgi:hypothetical protein